MGLNPGVRMADEEEAEAGHESRPHGAGTNRVLTIPDAHGGTPTPAFYVPDVRLVAGVGYRVTKRLMDVVLATSLLVLSLPVLLLIAGAIRLTSPGPALFRQRRTGHEGSEFVMWKFRTMHTYADPSMHRAFVSSLMRTGDSSRPSGIYKLVDDPRVTSVGHILRRTSLDELPQLFHVLSGRMSMVGPRPGMDYELEHYEPTHYARFAVKPGITGLWQVSGRNNLSFRQALDLDVEYVRRRSLVLDLLILAKTVPVVLARRGVA